MSTSLLRKGDARALVRFMQQTNISFELIRSNYAMEVKSETINHKFVAQMQSKQVFAAYAKIKSNVKDKEIPNVTRDELVYYQHDFRRSSFTKKVTNIDLSCAYATVLLNHNVITSETFNYLLRLPKQSRLVSVGMLASRKKSFFYKQGGIVDYSEKVSELSPFFYFAVKRTFEVMTNLRRICGKNYLFTWVDGIYFLPDADIQKECERYLASVNFGYKSESLENFLVDLLPRKIMVTFKKWSDKKQEWEHKVFNLPHKETVTQKVALSIIKKQKSAVHTLGSKNATTAFNNINKSKQRSK